MPAVRVPHVEFKQTGRVNMATGQRDKVSELMVIKTIAGFMNARGRTLLIDVADDSKIIGIERTSRLSAVSKPGWVRPMANRASRQHAGANGHVQCHCEL